MKTYDIYTMTYHKIIKQQYKMDVTAGEIKHRTLKDSGNNRTWKNKYGENGRLQ